MTGGIIFMAKYGESVVFPVKYATRRWQMDALEKQRFSFAL